MYCDITVQVITKLTGIDSEPNLALTSKKEQEDLLRQVSMEVAGFGEKDLFQL